MLAVLLLPVFSSSARAGCLNPTGNTGVIDYNYTDGMVQYCNGTNWVAMSAPTVNLAQGLVGWWKFDEGSGTSAADSSGTANTGTLQNSPTWTTSGRINDALVFNGTNQYVDVGNAASLNFERTQPFSISAWIYPVASGNNYNVIVGKRNSSGTYQGFDFVDYYGNSALFFTLFGVSSSAGLQVYSPPNSVLLNYWHHVAVTYDGTSSSTSVKMYVDGVSQAVNVPTNDLSSSILTGVDMLIGADLTTSSPFPGDIDDVRIYNRVLSATEVATLYAGAGATSGDFSTGLIHYWKLDETSGTTASDSVGGVTATLGGTAAFTTSGRINGALSLPDDGTAKTTSFTMPADMLGQSKLTLSMWYKRAAAFKNVQFGQENASANEIGIEVYSDGLVYFEIGSNGTYGGYAVANNDLNWHLATLVFDGTLTGDANRLKGFIDGVQQTMTEESGANSIPATTTAVGLTAYIGNFGTGTSQNAGTIDDVRVYSRALAPADVMALYNAYACGSPPGAPGQIVYNATSNVMQYCNPVTGWTAMGPTPGAGGGGCTSPAGAAGNMFYNIDKAVIQYCDGTNWIGMGETLPTSGLVGYWKFDDASGTSAADSTGNGNTGTLVNAPTWTTSGQLNGALTLASASTQYVNVANPANFAFERTQPFSISIWAFNTYVAGVEYMIGNQQNSGHFPGWYVEVDPVNHKIVMDLTGTTGGCGTDCITVSTPVSSFSSSAWHHLAITYDGTSTAAGTKIYIDGVLQTLTVGANGLASSILSSSNLTIGRTAASAATFGGTLDDVRVYNRVLSAQEVWQLYNGT